MANVMSMKSVKNKPHRDGFDLSKRNLFTAKIGELLPVYCKEVLPGDNFKINQKWFTRTRPVNTAAYTRIREYYDWFFVPTQLLWNKFETFISQTKDNPFHAASINDAQYTNDTHPFMNVSEIYDFLFRLYDSDGKKNFFGFDRSPLACKLLHYLGYGDYYNFNTPGSAYLRYREDAALNPFPLLAYQKIYQDYYRNSQWEKSAPWTCNLDYLYVNTPSAISYLKINTANIDVLEDSLFDLRYANWHKDLFMGVLPSAQFGDSASVDLSSIINIDSSNSVDTWFQILNGSGTSSNVSTSPEGLLKTDTYNDGNWQFTPQSYSVIASKLGLTPERLSSVFTILSLRQAEAMQKWKEITQSTQQDYKNQMEAHFGVSLSDAYSERCKFIDGFVNNVDISEVVNTNLADSSVEANIAGKGVGVGDNTLSFESKVHGYIICIYHAVPLLDYSSTGISRQNLKTNVIDYAIPEFDQTGMVQVPLVELSNRSFGPETDRRLDINLLGYAPRYYDYKQDKDEVHGAFYNGGDESWVAPIDDSYIKNYLSSIPQTSTSIDYRFFKIPPQVVDTIFGVNADDTTSSDHLLVNCGFDVKAVRNLDYSGLPY